MQIDLQRACVFCLAWNKKNSCNVFSVSIYKWVELIKQKLWGLKVQHFSHVKPQQLV